MSSYLIPILTCLLFYAVGYFYGKNYIYRDTKRKTKKIKKTLTKQGINPKKLTPDELTDLFKKAKMGFIVVEKEKYGINFPGPRSSTQTFSLEELLKQAIENEDYEGAAIIRDKIKKQKNKKTNE
jgi:excinuclease UvrABC helicase subunit UvrB